MEGMMWVDPGTWPIGWPEGRELDRLADNSSRGDGMVTPPSRWLVLLIVLGPVSQAAGPKGRRQHNYNPTCSLKVSPDPHSA
jgi:hypothetical protein